MGGGRPGITVMKYYFLNKFIAIVRSTKDLIPILRYVKE